ncbi:MAG: GNAT family N-acetyltransferase [Solirubrobacteraceae bacterium]
MTVKSRAAGISTPIAGRGTASEAAAALLARRFADGLDEVRAFTQSDNHPSIAVCRRDRDAST